MTKVGFISLGCSKNLVDTEVMLKKLYDAGFEITPDETEAEIIIINTCGFIESAKQESIDNILDAAKLREWGKCRHVIATGCLVERLPRVVWLVPKLVFANVAFAAVFGLYWLIFRISPFMFDNEWIAIGIWALGNFAFIIYDMFVTAMAKVYLLKYRKRFSRLLK